jgi:deoxyinosine 3'endonuclease (endonuclease V)
MEQEIISFVPFKRKILKNIPHFPLGSEAEKDWDKRVENRKKSGSLLVGRIIESKIIHYVLGEGDAKGWCIIHSDHNLSFSAYVSIMDNDFGFSADKGLCYFQVKDHSLTVESYSYNHSTNKKEYYGSLGIKRSDLNIDKLLSENPDIIQRMDEIIAESNIWENEITTIGYSYIHEPEKIPRAKRVVWAMLKKQYAEEGYVSLENDFMFHYVLQGELLEKVVKTDQLPENIRYVAGVDVAFHDLELRMVVAIVVLDARTFEVVDQVLHETDITFPYIPRLFSYREAPLVMEAWEKLRIKPDLLICDGHGIDHPRGIGLATHLGAVLDVPSIGCARLRLVGEYDPAKLGKEKGSTQPLLFEEQVGAVVRTQDGAIPLLVSIGHRVSVETAVDWVLRLCRHTRLPETTRQADRLVHTILPERTEFDFWAGAGPMSAVEPPSDWPDINKVLINRGVNED